MSSRSGLRDTQSPSARVVSSGTSTLFTLTTFGPKRVFFSSRSISILPCNHEWLSEILRCSFPPASHFLSLNAMLPLPLHTSTHIHEGQLRPPRQMPD